MATAAARAAVLILAANYPADAWPVLWQRILDWTAPQANLPARQWTSMVHPSFGGRCFGEPDKTSIARRLLDFYHFASPARQGDRGDPRHGAYGLVAWGISSPASTNPPLSNKTATPWPTCFTPSISLSSDNGQEFSAIKTVDRPPPQDNATWIHRFAVDGLSVRARHLRVRAKNSGPIAPGQPGAGAQSWLFVDEVVVDPSQPAASTGPPLGRAGPGDGGPCLLSKSAATPSSGQMAPSAAPDRPCPQKPQRPQADQSGPP